jgi:aspartokinase
MTKEGLHRVSSRARMVSEAEVKREGRTGCSTHRERRRRPGSPSALAASGPVFLTQGFIARDKDGYTVRSPRRQRHLGSYFRPAGRRRCEIWTDVPGVFTPTPAHPAALACARQLREPGVRSMGAKVLHRLHRALPPPRIPSR